MKLGLTTDEMAAMVLSDIQEERERWKNDVRPIVDITEMSGEWIGAVCATVVRVIDANNAKLLEQLREAGVLPKE